MGDLLLEDKNCYSSENLRKAFYVLEKIIDNIEEDFVVTDNDLVKLIEQKQQELNKDRVKFRDERNELNKLLREQARFETLFELLEDNIKENGRTTLLPKNNDVIESNNDLFVCISDVHIGAENYSTFGCYNSDIAKERLEQYLGEIIDIQKLHNSENCYWYVRRSHK
jgi:hypothetical protein